jgi:hypothetical protein
VHLLHYLSIGFRGGSDSLFSPDPSSEFRVTISQEQSSQLKDLVTRFEILVSGPKI